MRRNDYLSGILLLVLLLVAEVTFAQGGGLYDAEGWAAQTPGGRGGKIIRVTNLNASGAGSYAEAVKQTGARIIVFEVGGVIDLLGKNVSVKSPYATIAGQTAPSPGITFVNGTVGISTHDVIMQHIRVRPGTLGHDVGWEPDGISAVSAHHVIIDHCSASWSVDENCSASGPRFDGDTPDEWRANTSHDVTMSNNIIAEGLAYATHSKGLHSMGSLIHDNVTNMAVLRNLYSGNNARNPLFKAGAMGVVVNNYIYNPGSSGVRYGFVASEWEGHEVITGKMSVVSNYMQLGPDSKTNFPLMYAYNSPCELFLSGNIAKDTLDKDVQQFRGNADYLVPSKPIWNDNIDVMRAPQAKEYVLNHAGARPWDRDAIDARIVSDATNGTGHIINFETEVEGLPGYAQTSAPFNEEAWNLDLMLPIAPEITFSLANESDTLYPKSDYTVTATVDPTLAVNFVELLVDGVQYGALSQPPYSWSFTPDSTGDYTLAVVAETSDFELHISESKTVQIIDTTTVGSIRFDTGVAKDLFLSNVPNPFSNYTIIHYSLPGAQSVEVKVYNSMGKEMALLHSGYDTRGFHQLTWQPTDLQKGLYFVVLLSEGQSLCRKMLYQAP